MASNYEKFWNNDVFVFIGHSAKREFPRLSFKAVQSLGKTAYAVDPSESIVEGQKCYPDLKSLPEAPQAVVLEVPKNETAEWVQATIASGAKDLWIHMGTDTPEALELACKGGLNVRHGTCAVMYVTPGVSYHSIHKWIMKMLGKY
jgi:predicted CoA-binding protein